MQPIHEQLRALRLERGLSQKALGAAVQMPQSHVSAIEAGRVDPRLSSLTEIARVLDHEVILVPRKLLPAIQALVRGEPDAPLWQTDEEDSE
jgi:transcriptional regulator with XRE-family HTH domain